MKWILFRVLYDELINFCNSSKRQSRNETRETNITPQYRREYNSCETIQNWLQGTT